jgi:pilus assembly protein TadC
LRDIYYGVRRHLGGTAPHLNEVNIQSSKGLIRKTVLGKRSIHCVPRTKDSQIQKRLPLFDFYTMGVFINAEEIHFFCFLFISSYLLFSISIFVSFSFGLLNDAFSTAYVIKFNADECVF